MGRFAGLTLIQGARLNEGRKLNSLTVPEMLWTKVVSEPSFTGPNRAGLSTCASATTGCGGPRNTGFQLLVPSLASLNDKNEGFPVAWCWHHLLSASRVIFKRFYCLQVHVSQGNPSLPKPHILVLLVSQRASYSSILLTLTKKSICWNILLIFWKNSHCSARNMVDIPGELLKLNICVCCVHIHTHTHT